MSTLVFNVTPGILLLTAIFVLLVYFAVQIMLDPTTLFQRSIDLVVFGLLFVLCLLYLQTNLSLDDLLQKDYIRRGLSGALRELDSLNSVYFFFMGLMLIYLFSYVFSVTSTVTPLSFALAKDLFWFMFLMCGINEFMKWLFSYSLFGSLDKLLWNGTTTDAEAEAKRKKLEEEQQKNKSRGEVFHIGNQLYTYVEADEVCRLANDSRLATREEVEQAAKDGADWAGSYGWSTGQEAYTITKEKGVHGGKVKEGKMLLGVNCVGKKPDMTERDKLLMDMIRAESKGLDMTSQIKLLFAELNPGAYMTIRPFNFDKWSEAAAASSTTTTTETEEEKKAAAAATEAAKTKKIEQELEALGKKLKQ